MKTRFIYFAIAWLLSLGHVMADDKFVIDDVVVPQGKTVAVTLGFDFESISALQAFSFDVKFPEGLFFDLYKEDDLINDIHKGDTIFIKENTLANFSKLVLPEAGVFYFSLKNTYIGNSGKLVTFYICENNNLQIGDSFDVTVKNCHINYEGGEKDLPEFTFKVTIGDPRTVLDENSTTVPDASDGPIDIIVRRSLKAGVWNTICLPFDMTSAQMAEAFGSDVKLADFTGTEEPELNDAQEVERIQVNFATVTSIEANHPYIIKVSKAVNSFEVNGVTIDPSEDDAYIEFDNGQTGRKRVVYSGFYGTYHAGTAIEEDGLFLSENKFWYSTGSTTMKAYRAYFVFLDVLDNKELASVKMAIEIDGTQTSINAINNDGNADGIIYDLSGRRINKPQQRGVYIVDGKKVAIK